MAEKLIKAPRQLSALFLELLESQFPIRDKYSSLSFRSASSFARQLNVHVNHLNRSVKKNLNKTTTQVIADRLVKEATVMLLRSNWTVAEIAHSLAFGEAPILIISSRSIRERALRR